MGTKNTSIKQFVEKIKVAFSRRKSYKKVGELLKSSPLKLVTSLKR